MQAKVDQLKPFYHNLRRSLRCLKVRKVVHKMLAMLAAVDAVGTLEEEGLYHPTILLEALRCGTNRASPRTSCHGRQVCVQAGVGLGW